MASASPVSGHCHPRRARGTSDIILIVSNYLLVFLYVADPPIAPMRDTSQDRPVMAHDSRMMMTDNQKSPRKAPHRPPGGHMESRAGNNVVQATKKAACAALFIELRHDRGQAGVLWEPAPLRSSMPLSRSSVVASCSSCSRLLSWRLSFSSRSCSSSRSSLAIVSCCVLFCCSRSSSRRSSCVSVVSNILSPRQKAAEHIAKRDRQPAAALCQQPQAGP